MSDIRGPGLEKITLLIVDDHPIMREGLHSRLEIERDFKVLGEAGTGEVGLQMIRRLHPDVVLLDLNLPDITGIKVTELLRHERIFTSIILLTAHYEPEQVLQAMRAGVSAFCAKDIESDKLISVIRHVLQGNFVIGEKVYTERSLKQWLDTHFVPTPIQTPAIDMLIPLSTREMEILRAVVRGLSNKQIAVELGISHQTVKNHMTSILDKLQVEGRTQAAVYAINRGWVRREEYKPLPKDADF